MSNPVKNPYPWKEYLSFYWPLAVMGVANLLARQFENGALARFPEAAREIAVFAYASSIFFLFCSGLIFASQTVNVLGRSPQARRVILRMLLVFCAALTIPMALMAFTDLGEFFLMRIFDLKGATLTATKAYLKYLTPLILIQGLRQYCNGLLIQAKRTGLVTVLNIIFLLTVVGLLMLGLRSDWRPVTTVSLAQGLSGFIHLTLSGLACLRYYRQPEETDCQELTYRRAIQFFWPMVLTSMMFSLSRPILYSFVSRMHESEKVVAALRVAFDFSMIFHISVNQIRHLYVTYGRAHVKNLNRFTLQIAAGVTLLNVLVIGSPLGTFCLRELMNIRADLLDMSLQALWVLCLIPLAVTLRNRLHGYLMVSQRTRSMSLGGIMRNVGIYGLASLGYSAGWLNHATAAGIMVFGFLVETAVVVWFVRAIQKE